MKKTLIILISLILLISCATNTRVIMDDVDMTPESNKAFVPEDKGSETQQKKPKYVKGPFAPPEWLFGTWGNEMGIIIFEFTQDDVLSVFDNKKQSYKEIYSRDMISDPESSDVEYYFTINIPPLKQTYHFFKLSPTSIHYQLTTNGESSSFIELKKK